MRLLNQIQSLIGHGRKQETVGVRQSGPATHVIILDGTMSSLNVDYETHAGHLYKLLQRVSESKDYEGNLTIYYEPGIQWTDWGETLGVMEGRGINGQIKRSYAVLSTRYQTGDRIILSGYSRGAYAVRSLAGMIDLVGLVRTDCATERNIKLAYRHYRRGGCGLAAQAFRKRMCHAAVIIEAVAVWDTVKALGMRLPILWRWSVVEHEFHNHALGASVRQGFHALALDETREAYLPVLWTCSPDWSGKMEQVWFPGTHGDVGGQISGYEPARPLANLSLVWMLRRLECCEIPLPDGWAAQFPTDAKAPSSGKWRGWAKLFWSRKARVVGADASESLHPSVAKNRPDDTKIAWRK